MSLALVASCVAGYALWGERPDDSIRVAGAVLGLVALVGEPLVILVHELGHAVAVVALTGQRATVQVGRDPALVRFSVGRIDLHWDPRGLPRSLPDASAGLSPPDAADRARGSGRLASARGGLCNAGRERSRRRSRRFWTLFAVSGTSLFAALFNSVPLRSLPRWWPGALRTGEEGPSDGYIALQALRAIRGRASWHDDPSVPEAVMVDIATGRSPSRCAGRRRGRAAGQPLRGH